MKIVGEVKQAFLGCRALAPGQWTAEFEFQPDLEIFQGHFPGRPMVPGIYLLQCLQMTCEQGLGRNLRMKTVKQAKFLRPVIPLCRIQARVRVAETGQGLTLRGEILDRGQTAASAVWEGE